MAKYEDAEAPNGVQLYDFENYDEHRQLIFDDVMKTMQSQFPREHNGVRMELSNLEYADPDHFSIADQKKAIHDDGYLKRRLRGTITLTNTKTGEVLDQKTMTLMNVPWLSNRGTFIRGGNEWGSISQKRLMPGAYSRYQNNGDLETQFNVRPGTGGAFRVQFNPESAQYKMAIKGGEIHLYSLLHDLGVSDDELEASWGQQVLEVNRDKYDSRTLDKAYNKIVPEWDREKNGDRSDAEKARIIRNALNRSQMSTAVAKRTLPNLFSSEKRAAWRTGGAAMEKMASMTRNDMEEVAAYINAITDTQIPLDASREELKEAIMNTITTGDPNVSPTSGEADTNNPGVRVVRQIRMKRVVESLNKKLTNHHIEL